jgi:hypothetical protein
MRNYRYNWLDLFYGFRIALDPRKMFLGFLMIAVFLTASWICDFSFATWAAIGDDAKSQPIGLLFSDEKGEWDGAMTAAHTHWQGLVGGLLAMSWTWASWKGYLALAVVWGAAWYFLIAPLWGAICRLAAVEFATEERLRIVEVTDYVKPRLKGFALTPLAIKGLVIFFIGTIWFWALAAQIPWLGPFIAPLVFPLVVIASFLAALVFLGGLFGGHMIGPALATEGLDGFDALSRSFSYLFSRAWQNALYLIINLIYGFLCIALVWGFFATMGLMASWGASAAGLETPNAHTALVVASDAAAREDGVLTTNDLTMWDEFRRVFGPKIAELHNMTAGRVAGWLGWDTVFGVSTMSDPKQYAIPAATGLNIFEKWFVYIAGAQLVFIGGMIGAFAISIFVTQSTIQYFILRKKVDDTGYDEIYIPEDEEEAADLGSLGLSLTQGATVPKSVGDAVGAAVAAKGEDKPADAPKSDAKPDAKPEEKPEEKKDEKPADNTGEAKPAEGSSDKPAEGASDSKPDENKDGDKPAS